MLETRPASQLERCPTCSGTLKSIPEPDTGLIEAKCLQCGRVAYDRPDPTATAGSRFILDETEDGSGRIGVLSRYVEPSITISTAAGRQLYRLLTTQKSVPDHVFRLDGTAGNVSLGVGIVSRNDIVLFHHGKAVLAVHQKVAEQIGDAEVVVRRRNGRMLVALARPRRTHEVASSRGGATRPQAASGVAAREEAWRDMAMEAS